MADLIASLLPGLYETRGCVEGLDREDWFNAEREVFNDLNHPAEITALRNETKTVVSGGLVTTLKWNVGSEPIGHR